MIVYKQKGRLFWKSKWSRERNSGFGNGKSDYGQNVVLCTWTKIIMKPITLYDKCIVIFFEYCEWMPPFLPALRHVLRSGSPGRDSLGVLSSVSQLSEYVTWPQASGLSMYFPDKDCNEFHDLSVRVPVLICDHSLYHILQIAYRVYTGSKPKYL